MYEREAALVAYYDRQIEYWSPVATYRVAELAKRVGVTLTAPLLDVGCGDGRLRMQVHFEIDGVDVSTSRLALAQITFPGSSWHQGDVYRWLMRCKKQYQTITAFDVLEHLEKPDLVVFLARQRLVEDGVLLATVPIDMDIHEHLQLYADVNAVERALQPDRIEQVDTFAVCRWNKE